MHAIGGFQSAMFTKRCMGANEYHFITHWRVQATAEEVSDVLGEPAGLPRWWPSVYLAVHEIEHGSESGVGRVVELHTQGWLPYTLHWFFRVTESRRPFGFSLEAWGDFEGTGGTIKITGSGGVWSGTFEVTVARRLTPKDTMTVTGSFTGLKMR